ncbi:glycosyltransferase family 2 protein [Caldibacillus thermoamylovorans]
MNKKPLVYIVIVNYNGLQDTIECINSIKKSTYENYKVVVVDNGSTDNSVSTLIKEFRDVKLIKSQENLGFSGGNNIGIMFALNQNADYVCLLNNDTVVSKDFLKELVEVAINYKDVGIVGGQINFFDNPLKIWFGGGILSKVRGNAYHRFIHMEEEDKVIISEEDFITGCLQLISRDVINKVGLLNDDYFLYYEDTDYCCRVRNAGYKLIYTNKSKIYHKVSQSTGEKSALFYYYNTRNRLIFIRNNFNGLAKSVSLFYAILTSILKLFIFKNRYIYIAIKDFFLGRKGKYTKEF